MGGLFFSVVLPLFECKLTRPRHLQPSMSNIVVKDLMVSKQHARLTAAPSLGPCVYDLKSKHGTVASVRKPGAQGEGDQVKRFPVPVPPEGLMLRIGDQVSLPQRMRSCSVFISL